MTKKELVDWFGEVLIHEAYDAALSSVAAYIDGRLKTTNRYAELEDECKTDDERKLFIARMTTETLLHNILHLINTNNNQFRLQIRKVTYSEEGDQLGATDWLDTHDVYPGELSGMVVGDAEYNWIARFSKFPSISAELSRRFPLPDFDAPRTDKPPRKDG